MPAMRACFTMTREVRNGPFPAGCAPDWPIRGPLRRSLAWPCSQHGWGHGIRREEGWARRWRKVHGTRRHQKEAGWVRAPGHGWQVFRDRPHTGSLYTRPGPMQAAWSGRQIQWARQNPQIGTAGTRTTGIRDTKNPPKNPQARPAGAGFSRKTQRPESISSS